VGAFLPAVPVIHSGFELGTPRPVNTGLDFDDASRARYPENELPLYNAFALPWDGQGALLDPIRRILEVRSSVEDLAINGDPVTIIVPRAERAVAYIRSDGKRLVIVAANPSDRAVTGHLSSPTLGDRAFRDAVTGEDITSADDRLSLSLGSWGARVLLGSTSAGS
jgi:hypothetical protein